MALQQLGGLTCFWNDGDTLNDPYDGTFRSLKITILPEAEAKWDRYAEEYEISGDESRYCYARDDYICGYFALVNGTWIESYVEGIRPASVAVDADAAMIEHVRPLFDAMAAAVSTAQSTGDRWLPSALPLPGSCEAFIAPSDIAALAGVTAALDSYTYRDGPQVDQTLSLDDEYLTKSCYWSYQGTDGGIGMMGAVPGGAWAWDVGEESSGATSLTIEGLPDDQYGYYQCTEYQRSRSCNLNFILGGNWFELTLYESDGSYDPAFDADQPETLSAIAEKIIANMS